MSLFRSLSSHDGKQILKGIVHNDGTVTNVIKVTITSNNVYREKRLNSGAEYRAAVARLKQNLPV